MPFNGSGVYSLPSTTVTPAVNGTTIDDTDFNTFTADLETALTLCIAKDGQTSSPTLTNPKILTKILDTNSNELLEFGTTASAVNHLLVENSATGVSPKLRSSGESDIGIVLFDSNNNQMLRLLSAASAVNWIDISNRATGLYPFIQAEGEANIGIDLTDSNGNLHTRFRPVVSAVNSLELRNAKTNEFPSIRPSGEANRGIQINDSNGNVLSKFTPVASAVNWLGVVNASTGNNATIRSGGEANRGVAFRDSNNNELTVLHSTANAVNRVDLYNSTTGNPARVEAEGDDTNIDLQLGGKGTGGVYGTLKQTAVQATTSGTTKDFSSIPSWCKRITFNLYRVSCSTSGGSLDITIGDSGGLETSGYEGVMREISTGSSAALSSAWTIAYELTSGVLNTASISGTLVMTLQDSSTNSWCIEGACADHTTGQCYLMSGGSKSLSSTLDRFRLTLSSGGTFDAGKISAIYEG